MFMTGSLLVGVSENFIHSGPVDECHQFSKLRGFQCVRSQKGVITKC